MNDYLEMYEMYDNPFTSGLQTLICERKSTRGCIWYIGEDTPYILAPIEYVDTYSPIDDVVVKISKTKTPLIYNKPFTLKCLGEVNRHFGIPIQNKDKVLGVLILCNGEYSIQLLKKWNSLLLILRLEMEKIQIPTKITQKDLFVANLSHEIRTPLNGVVGYTQLLLQTNVTPIQAEYLRSINKCSLNLTQIINDILDFSKITSGKMKITNEVCKIPDIISTVIDILSPKLASRSFTWECKVNNHILTDKQKLIQILMNILSNSIKFTSDSHKTIEGKECGIIKLSVVEDGGNIQFKIKDNGIGISRNDQTKLFRNFSQIGVATEGSGLGLVIVKKLLELLNGDIRFTRKEGVGREFCFSIENIVVNIDDRKECIISDKWSNVCVAIIPPDEKIKDILKRLKVKYIEYSKVSKCIDCELIVTNKKLQSSLQKIPIVQYTSDLIDMKRNIEDALKLSTYIPRKYVDTNKNILIAEDNKDNQDVLVKMIQTLGYTRITVKNDGIETIQELQRGQSPMRVSAYDVLFLDLKMPNIDGYKVMEYIHKVNLNIKVIPVTASVSEDDQVNCKKYTNYFLKKPIDIRELQKVI